jgi:hypothetical protein
MPSPKVVDTLLAIETQKALSLPVAALVMGAISQVEALIDLADRVCDPIFRSASRQLSLGCPVLKEFKPAQSA